MHCMLKIQKKYVEQHNSDFILLNLCTAQNRFTKKKYLNISRLLLIYDIYVYIEFKNRSKNRKNLINTKINKVIIQKQGENLLFSKTIRPIMHITHLLKKIQDYLINESLYIEEKQLTQK